MINLGPIKLEVDVHIDERLRYLWIFRNHFKRYVKRYIPWIAMTCDWCGQEIGVAPWRDCSDPGWIAMCLHCSEEGWGWLASADTEEEVRESWRMYGGDEFHGDGIHFRPRPPWLKPLPVDA